MDAIQLTKDEILDANQENKFLTFNLDDNAYGIPILKVSEIIGITSITPVPKIPKFIKGVINLRGKIIPVMDLRLKFEMNEKEYNQNTCIIIINLEFKEKIKQIGIVVDIVSEVCNIPASEIEDAPAYSSESDDDFLSGVGKIKDKVVMLLDIEKVIFTEELVHLYKDDETL